MWILHPKIGFLSAVEKVWDAPNGTLTIRARVHDDLVRLKTYLPEMSEIVESHDSDYRFRVSAPRSEFSTAMAKLSSDIDYDNFKNAVAEKQGYRRASVYGNVWSDLLKLETL